MKFVFLIDPPHLLVDYKDSTIVMMREAQARGHEVWVCGNHQVLWHEEQCYCQAAPIKLAPAAVRPWYSLGEYERVPATKFSALVLRKDPPFDIDYVSLTWLLERMMSQGTPVVNDPRSVRDCSEKLSILEFPNFIPETLVSCDQNELLAFVKHHGQAVIKPLDSMGGRGVFRLTQEDPNRKVIIETLTHQGTRLAMAQRYISRIAEGDKRVLLIDGKPMPTLLARVPSKEDFRGNLAAGAKGEVRPLSSRDREIAETLGPVLAKRGLTLVGLDIIGDFLTEINVTSPTGFVELEKAGTKVGGLFIDALESASKSRH